LDDLNKFIPIKHFYYFITEFSLVDKKEMEPLKELIENLTKGDKFEKK